MDGLEAPTDDWHAWCLLQFESPVLCAPHALFIASKLDTDVHANTCRLAFHGRVSLASADPASALAQLKIARTKTREGVVDRMHDESTVIVRDLINKDAPVDKYTGLRVTLSTGEAGVIEGGFGQTGKLRVRCMQGLQPATVAVLAGLGKKKGKADAEIQSPPPQPIRVTLTFKRYDHDPARKMHQ